MRWPTPHSVVTCTAGLLLGVWPVHVGAQEASPDGYLTINQVQTAYTAQGYEIERTIQSGAASTWSRVTGLVVSAPPEPASARARAVMVLIFPNRASADLNRDLANDQDPDSDTGGPQAGQGPHLIQGYGYSSWFENAAIVESSDGSVVPTESVVDQNFLTPLIVYARSPTRSATRGLSAANATGAVFFAAWLVWRWATFDTAGQVLVAIISLMLGVLAIIEFEFSQTQRCSAACGTQQDTAGG